MAFQRINEVIIGGNPAGTIFNGFIYAFSVKFGSSTTPTSIDVSVVSKNGIYSIKPPTGHSQFGSMSATKPVSIKIVTANGSPVINFSRCYLVNYSTSTSVGQKTLQLKFVDQSIILDKIQVALLNENVSKYNFGTWAPVTNMDMVTYEQQGMDILDNGKAASTVTPRDALGRKTGLSPADRKKLLAQFFIQCPNCDPRKQSEPWAAQITQPYVSERGFIAGVDPSYGGFLALGTEEYASSDCQLKNVSYNFSEFLYALSIMFGGGHGLRVLNMVDKSLVNQMATGQQLVPYRAKHTGTLREVLNSWCADFGYSWVMDPFNGTILGVDLSTEITNLRQVESIANNLGSNSGVAVESISQNYSIEDTHRQFHTSNFRRPAKTKNISTNIYEKRAFSNVRIEELIPCDRFGPRNLDEFVTSCVLAKFNKEARTLYNWMLCRSCGDLSPLGINLKYKLTQDEKEKLVNTSFSNVEAFEKNKKYGANADVWIGTYSQELENKWLDWENLVAEFLGRWYKIDDIAQDSYICGKPIWEKNFKVTTSPSSEVYEDPYDPATGQLLSDDFPFSDILKHPKGARIQGVYPMRLFSRGALYGTKEEDLEDIFKDADGSSVLQEHVPTVEYIDGTVKAGLYNLLTTVFPSSIGVSLESMQDKDKPALIFAPEVSVLEKQIQIGPLEYKYTNAKERKAEENERKEEDKVCELMCDEDPIIGLCDEACEDNFDDYVFGKYTKDVPSQKDVRLSSTKSWGFTIRTNSKALDSGQKVIVLPSMNTHYGYITYSSEYRKTLSSVKRCYGELGHAGETMKVSLNAVDITSDVESLSGGDIGEGRVLPPMIIIPKYNKTNSVAQMVGAAEIMNAHEYHEKTKILINNDLAKETLDLTLIGDFRRVVQYFGPYLSPDKGLMNLSLSVKEDGQTISLSFANKPVQFPHHDVTMQKVNTSLNLNTFARTF